MNEIAIRIQNLSKCYHVYDTPRDRLKQFVLPGLFNLTGKGQPCYFKEFWALRDVTFEVASGETVGIVGRNGSGKSTLLQMICGTLFATTGEVSTRGRVAALLELGAGFNPDFTGRENVYLNGAILGLSHEEIDSRFESIVTFANIGKFIELPVKMYSSGMVVRLAFAVAINVDPQILIVDEALAVGDELFQRKCFARIEEIKARGATILFVTHSAATVVELCDRAVLLDDGELLAIGAPKQVVADYQRLLYAPEEKRRVIREELMNAFLLSLEDEATDHHESRFVTERGPDEESEPVCYDPNLKSQSMVEYEPRGVRIKTTEIHDASGQKVNLLQRGRRYRYSYQVCFDRHVENVRFGMLIKTISGVELGGGVSAPNPQEGIPIVHSGAKMQASFEFRCALSTGSYFLNAGVVGNIGEGEEILHRVLDAQIFRVLPEMAGHHTGMVDFDCKPDFINLSAD